jgi:exonuclease SbcC
MKILSVRFKNLNSLVGEWIIDFTHPDYSSDGIFAITGPTGAGKTTILDAICLGLYGRTPRLEKVTKSSNEIMSRQAGECFAEVCFQTQNGRYRCHWSQHRARKRPDGELQQARHEISDADSGVVLESRINQVSAFIDGATGMDFDRFTRSMLLAQGGFAAFLQARPDERSPILEQITGTEIYSRISMQVHERRSMERERLDLMQAELAGIHILTNDEERDLQADLKAKGLREEALSGKVEKIRQALAWLEGITTLERELTSIHERLQRYEERQQAFEPDSARLKKALMAMGIEADYRDTATLRAQQGLEKNELHEAIALLPRKREALVAAQSVKQSAWAGLCEAQERLASESETIRRVRTLDILFREQKEHLVEKDRAISEAESQAREYVGSREKNENTLKQLQAVLESVLDYQAKHAADAALIADLAAIAAAIRLFRERETGCQQVREAIAEVTRRMDAITAEDEAIRRGHEELLGQMERVQGDIGHLVDETETTLKGRDIGKWRDEMVMLKEREHHLVRAVEWMERMDKSQSERDRLEAALENLHAGHARRIKAMGSLSDRKEHLEKQVSALEAQVSLVGRIRSLEQERNCLEDGSPCPLCGATEHPYAKGNVPELSGYEASLKKAKDAWNNVSGELGTVEKELAAMGADIRHTEDAMKEKQEVFDVEKKRFNRALQELDIKTTAKKQPQRVYDEISLVQEQIASASRVVAIAGDKERNLESMQKTLEDIRKKIESSAGFLRETARKLEAAEFERQQMGKEYEIREKEIEKSRVAVFTDVRPFGIKLGSEADLDATLQDLTSRRDVWLARQGEKAELEKGIHELKAKIDRDTALLLKLEKDVAEMCEQRANMLKQYEATAALRRGLYGDKDTDQEEKRLTNVVEKARDSFEKAREACEMTEREMSTLKEKIGLLETKTEAMAKKLTQSEKSLMERFAKAGFDNESDYLTSCLPEDRRELLVETEKALIKEKTELDARLRDRSDALAKERSKCLTDQPAETIKEELVACELELRQLRTDMGGITRVLSEDESLKRQQQQRLGQIEAQRRECSRWDDLHLIIGSADGKKFRNFAQGLTFEIMIKHANLQLRKMSDRYLLVSDSSLPLELNVIDHYQAGEIRSTKNLSGGESFLVSLALALGLSRMASRNVRVDSLFLDEGFGTLDDDALETALEALAELHQDGKVIGVISHVPAIKERIAAQIQVIPGTGGRSTLAGPGCRRA